jgi:ankyrin repeat protein
VQALISANANVGAFDHDGAAAQHAAAFNGQLATLMVLVESGQCDLLLTDNENQTAREAARQQQQGDCACLCH